jgi:hypothetical protein
MKKLHKFGYENCHVITILANPRNLRDEIINKQHKEELENFSYKEILESIQFVTIGSRLNNSYSIGSATIFGAKPKKAHCQVVSKIMKHFKGALNFAFTYGESFQNNVL